MEILQRGLQGIRSGWWVAALVLTALLGILFVFTPRESHAENDRVVTVYYDGLEKTVVTNATTVEGVLERAGISLGANDAVEPGLKTELSAPTYNINIHRARPVTIVDGTKKQTISSPYTSPRTIAQSAGLTVQDEDLLDLTRSDDLMGDGAGLKLTIDRATPVILVLYGTQKDVYTQSVSIGGFLQEKGIKLGQEDGMNLGLGAAITPGAKIEVWRNGVQTLTEEKEVAFSVETIRDADKLMGSKEVKEAGKLGKKLVTYEIEMRNGVEVGRKEIQSVLTEQAKKQVEVIGIKSNGKADPAANQAIAFAMMPEFGFGEDQWSCLLNLWNRESGWNQYKANYQGSGAYGIPQALPGSKMGPGWESDPVVQIRWGLSYIKGRYTNPCGAWNAFLSRTPHWY